MSAREDHIAYLFIAELQFRLASAVRIATTRDVQPFDLPITWTHGEHSVRYEEIALRADQGAYAACFMQRSATYLMAVAVKDAIKAVIPDPKHVAEPAVRSAFEIARLVRNAFAHAPFAPAWSIDPDCRDHVFEVPNVIRLDTHGLQGASFDWRHYGGLLAMLKLCRYARLEILKDDAPPRTVLPLPTAELQQIGDILVQRVDAIPPGATPIDVQPDANGRIPLGGGYVIVPLTAKNSDE